MLDTGVIKLSLGSDYSKHDKHIEFIKTPELQGRIGLGMAEFGIYFYGAYINDTNSDEDYERGDLYVSTKIRLLDEKKFYPYISFKSEVKVPTAADERNIGTDETDFFSSFIAKKKFGKFKLNIEAGLEILGDPESNQSQDDGFIYAVMGEYNLGENINVALEFYGDILEGRRNRSYFSGLVIYTTTRNFDIYTGFRKGVNIKTEDWGGYLGISYSFNLFEHLKKGEDHSEEL